MPVEKKKNGCYHVHNTTTKKCLDKKTANKQLAAIEISKHMHESNIVLNGFIYEAMYEEIGAVANDDPTSEELHDYLNSIAKQYEADEVNIEGAIYWFANDYHSGQDSNLYSTLSTSPYHPSRMANGIENEDEITQMLYEDLVSKFTNNSLEDKLNENIEDVDIEPKLIDMYADDEDGTFLSSINAAEDNEGTFTIRPSKNPVELALKVLNSAHAHRYNNEYDPTGLWYVAEHNSEEPNTLYKIGKGWTTEEIRDIANRLK